MGQIMTPAFYSRLKDKILQASGSPIICFQIGDWNLVLDFTKDTYSYLRENNPRAKLELKKMNENLDMIDIWRTWNPESKKYTWVSGKKATEDGKVRLFPCHS